MTKLYAQPYNIDATGFYFDSLESYRQQSASLRDSYGQPVEEFEIQFIDGEDADMELFNALGIHQGDIGAFFEAIEGWDDDEKTRVAIAVGECGYDFDLDKDRPEDIDMDIYELDSLTELAEEFVENGLFGTIPDNIRNYLDMEAIACDLGVDYHETVIAGRRLVYRCA
ncbi:MAG: antirestriction protein ArdA [Flavobacteriales bacterium]|jgi:antirestriction protein|nr:antirestriction protein ArdA [Flavobacteriales bacterium]